jgi:chromosome segregation ATPase
MALSAVDVRFDDSGDPAGEAFPYRIIEAGDMYMPVSRSAQGASGAAVHPRYDGELIALRRRIAELEEERAASNRAINELLLQAAALERSSRDALAALDEHRARIAAYIDAECAAVAADNERLAARIGALQASRAWACARFVRSLLGRFR